MNRLQKHESSTGCGLPPLQITLSSKICTQETFPEFCPSFLFPPFVFTGAKPKEDVFLPPSCFLEIFKMQTVLADLGWRNQHHVSALQMAGSLRTQGEYSHL